MKFLKLMIIRFNSLTIKFLHEIENFYLVWIKSDRIMKLFMRIITRLFYEEKDYS